MCGVQRYILLSFKASEAFQRPVSLSFCTRVARCRWLGLGLGSGSGSGLGLGFPTPSPALTLIYPHPHPRPALSPIRYVAVFFLVCVGKEHPAPGASGTPTTPSIYSSMSGRVRADAMSLMRAYRECAVSFAVLGDQCVMRGSFLTDYVHFFRSFLFENRPPQ